MTLLLEDDAVAISPARSITVGARHQAREDDGFFADADRDVLAREERLQVLLERRDRRLDHDVVLPALCRRPRRSG